MSMKRNMALTELYLERIGDTCIKVKNH
jgi:hypothetical protein